jgi:hypothetical protein
MTGLIFARLLPRNVYHRLLPPDLPGWGEWLPGCNPVRAIDW